jgi:hypothetical protein
MPETYVTLCHRTAIPTDSYGSQVNHMTAHVEVHGHRYDAEESRVSRAKV